MLVRFITVSNDRNRQRYSEDFAAAFREHAENTEFNRFAFGGSTAQGRSGIVLDTLDLKISGHKIDPMPEGADGVAIRFTLAEARKGLQALADGHDVLIGDKSHGLLARWLTSTLEVFGFGEDSEDPLS